MTPTGIQIPKTMARTLTPDPWSGIVPPWVAKSYVIIGIPAILDPLRAFCTP